eukprot:Nk52_evm42s270 gene=Nk52_evmTU42s270
MSLLGGRFCIGKEGRRVFARAFTSSAVSTRSLVVPENIKSRRYDNKVAIVTASTDGIGLAIARRLGQEGAHVVISSRKEANVNKALEELKSEGLSVSGMAVNVNDGEQRKKMIEETAQKYGGIDVLVSNAGASLYFGPLMGTPESMWRKMFDTNVTSSFLIAQDAMPHMQKGSSMLFVSSIGAYQPLPLIGCYSVTKTALLGLSRAIAEELGPEGIRVNCLAPGIIRTKFSKALTETDSLLEIMMEMTPLRRVGVPEECASVAAFLCSEDASYITGECIAPSGGMRSRL